ncbi:hypothetical protein AMQ68_03045 [Chryseobacterium sp. ERMR1:04]|nr:hypothetical protein AMQ68_03045 [Chryseobacterium sp. ERMR1:04]
MENLKIFSLKNLIKENDQAKKYLKKKTKAIALYFSAITIKMIYSFHCFFKVIQLSYKKNN